MIDLSLEGRKVISIGKNICRKIIPKPRGGREETAAVPLNTSVAQFHTVPVGIHSLACATGSWQRLWYSTHKFRRAVTKIITIEKREGGHLTAKREGIKGVCKFFIINESNGFRLHSVKDGSRAGATPDVRAIFQARTNEAYIKLKQLFRRKIFTTPKQNAQFL